MTVLDLGRSFLRGLVVMVLVLCGEGRVRDEAGEAVPRGRGFLEPRSGKPRPVFMRTPSKPAGLPPLEFIVS